MTNIWSSFITHQGIIQKEVIFIVVKVKISTKKAIEDIINKGIITSAKINFKYEIKHLMILGYQLIGDK